jgi:phage/plasmid-like protein (TIGR03299 family)
MAHEIDEMAPGVHAAVFARTDAWHQLGTTLPEEFTAAQAMEHAHLGGWNVRGIPVTGTEITEAGVTTIEIPKRYAMVRTNPITGETEYLGGVTGGHYQAIQNEEHVDLLDAITDESGAHFDTAGSLRGGADVFVGMKLPDALTIGGKDGDRIDLNLIALNNHTGASKFKFLVSPVRVVCANTQEAAIKGALRSFGIRHDSGASHKVQEAREALGLTFRYVEAFQTEAEALLARPITNRQYGNFLDKLYDIDGRLDASATKLKQIDALEELYRTAPTLEGIRGTRWGAYQAVTEYWDHIAPVRAADAAEGRANRSLTSHATIQMKERAFQLASAR